MPNFFFHSESGDGLFLVRRLEREGHRVRTYLHDPKAKNLYRGILKTPAVQRPTPERGEIVIFDMVKFGTTADRLRRSGYKVIGASGFADAIEIDRGAGTRVMRDIGVKTPETHSFRTLSDGQKFLKSAKGRWYYKPNGNQDTSTTFNSEPEMLTRYLEWSKREPPERFELQKGVEGTEISLEGWFDGERWVWPFNSTVEDKKLMAGDVGPRTGCMSNVVWAYEDSRPTLALKTLIRLAPFLEEAGHVGPVDLNMIFDDQGEPYGLEWSPRFGYDALHALSMLTEGDLGHQLALFADGRLDRFETRTDAYAMTLRMSVPPYPDYAHAKDAEGVPVDASLVNDPTVHLGDVMLGANGPVITGSDASVATLTAVGTDLDGLRKKLVNKASELATPNLQYRTDPVKRAESVVSALEKHAYDKPAIRVVTPPRPMFDFSKPEKESKPPRAVPGDNTRVKTAIPNQAPVNYDIPTFK